MRCCAQRLGPHYPPIFYSGGAKIENDETQCKSVKRFFMQQVRTTPPYSIRVALNYRYFAKKKSEKNMSTTNAKIELWFEPELNFCTFWGLENEPPKAL